MKKARNQRKEGGGKRRIAKRGKEKKQERKIVNKLENRKTKDKLNHDKKQCEK